MSIHQHGFCLNNMQKTRRTMALYVEIRQTCPITNIETHANLGEMHKLKTEVHLQPMDLDQQQERCSAQDCSKTVKLICHGLQLLS
jgi:hypothetical protein